MGGDRSSISNRYFISIPPTVASHSTNREGEKLRYKKLFQVLIFAMPFLVAHALAITGEKKENAKRLIGVHRDGKRN